MSNGILPESITLSEDASVSVDSSLHAELMSSTRAGSGGVIGPASTNTLCTNGGSCGSSDNFGCRNTGDCTGSLNSRNCRVLQ